MSILAWHYDAIRVGLVAMIGILLFFPFTGMAQFRGSFKL
jgi:hypothetical protein